jgi:hypothetical protein
MQVEEALFNKMMDRRGKNGLGRRVFKQSDIVVLE